MISSAKYTASNLDLFSVDEIKTYLQVPEDVVDADDLLQAHIKEAKSWAERITNRLIGVCAAEQVWSWSINEKLTNIGDFKVQLKYGIVTAVTAIYAYDSDAESYAQLYSNSNPAINVAGITVSNTTGETPTRVAIKGLTTKYTKIKVNYSCGNGSGTDIPGEVKQGMRRFIWYQYNPDQDKNGKEKAEGFLDKQIIGRYGH